MKTEELAEALDIALEALISVSCMTGSVANRRRHINEFGYRVAESMGIRDAGYQPVRACLEKLRAAHPAQGAHLVDVPFRGDRTLALMCRDQDCDKEAEVLVPGSGEPEHPREEWCRAHYEPRRKPTDCTYLLIRASHPGEKKEGA